MRTFLEFIQNNLKPWKAKKAEVLDFWRKIQPNLPIRMKPVDEGHKGTRFRSDGIRITGSPEFINSVMSRIKDVADFETPGYRLDVEYRQIEPTALQTTNDKYFVFYAHLVKEE